MQQSNTSEDQRSVLIECYGYNYSHLDRYGRVKSPRTCALTVTTSLDPKGYIDFKELENHGRIYFSYFQVKLNPHLINARKLLFQKVFVERALCHVGKTSFIEKGYLKASDNKTLLASSVMVSVHVDDSTRKKLTLPDWFLQKYGDIKNPVRYPEFPEVTKNWSCTVKVHASDTNSYQHTNFASYVTYTEDAVYKFQKSLGNIDWMKNYSLEEILINYLDDSLQGEELCVYVTPDSNSDFFVFVEKDSNVILESKLRYCKALSGSLWSKI